MTLKEIEKIIDEANYYLVKDEEEILPLDTTVSKEQMKHDIKYYTNTVGRKYVFYKYNEETEEVTILAKVDHVDKEKKIIKKKLGDMSDEEIENFKKRVCCKHSECFDCPFYNGETREDYSPCYEAFIYYRSGYLKYKNREIEIEVEE